MYKFNIDLSITDFLSFRETIGKANSEYVSTEKRGTNKKGLAFDLPDFDIIISSLVGLVELVKIVKEWMRKESKKKVTIKHGDVIITIDLDSKNSEIVEKIIEAITIEEDEKNEEV